MALKFHHRHDTAVELQIAPMADIGFLLLCFFIVTAKPQRHEADVSMSLPGSVSDEATVDLPEEVKVVILPDGSVQVNDLTVGQAKDADMPALKETLSRFREAADSNKTKALVTVDAADRTTHQRIVDVLNTCAQAGIRGVTLSDASDEEAQ
jgi:biopolymer transport protein ExbD